MNQETFPPYEYREYPKWLYREDKDPVLVKNVDEEVKLGAGWQDMPIDPLAAVVAAEKEGDDMEERDILEGQPPRRRGRPPRVESEA